LSGHTLIGLGALNGLAAVALGAFAAHALDGAASPAAMAWWRTAGNYQLAHAVATLVMALAHERGVRGARRAAWCFVIGSWTFAGALYALALGAPRGLGAVAPVGGGLLLAGWLSVLAPLARNPWGLRG
jgi:uncharacterized membrane protein YgdD (TMEM256/DUF423 family)